MIDTIGMTDIGNGRPSNQDAYLLRQKEKNGKLYLLAVVCDGMGGLKKGEIASHYIVEVLKQWFDETLFDGLETMGIDMIEQNLIDLIRRINQNLLLMSRRMEETKSMGSTLTLLFVEEHEFFVLNVGDSRTYWFDRDRKFVTTDHTLAELELRAGHLTKEQAKKDMESMLDYVDKLNELDTSSVEPMSHVFPVKNVFREDVVTNGDGSEDTLKNAPEAQDNAFVVPKTII